MKDTPLGYYSPGCFGWCLTSSVTQGQQEGAGVIHGFPLMTRYLAQELGPRLQGQTAPGCYHLSEAGPKDHLWILYRDADPGLLNLLEWCSVPGISPWAGTASLLCQFMVHVMASVLGVTECFWALHLNIQSGCEVKSNSAHDLLRPGGKPSLNRGVDTELTPILPRINRLHVCCLKFLKQGLAYLTSLRTRGPDS